MAESQRILAAIIFTDVVGYTVRIQHEEEKTIGLVKRDLALFTKLCEASGGKVVKNTGDGLLMFFTSLDAAMKTAQAMLENLEEATKIIPPADRLEHRIGIHLGDVVFQGDDVMGEGVNIAARLMAEALPDTMCISQSGFDIIKNRTTLHYTLIGPRQLKNIKDPVPAVLMHTTETLPSPKVAEPTLAVTRRKTASKWEIAAIVFLPIVLLAGLGVYFVVNLPSGRAKRVADAPVAVEKAQAPAEPVLKLDPNKPFAKVNLLDLIKNPTKDATLGNWSWTETGGLSVAMADPNGEGLHPEAYARIAIPVPKAEIPEEYDLTVNFTRQSGSKPVALIFVMGRNQGVLEMGAWTRENDVYKEWAWVNAINGAGLVDSPSRSSFRIEASRKYVVVLKVRKGKVIATLDGSEFFRTDVDAGKLSNPSWPIFDGFGLGLGSCRGAVIFHSVELSVAKSETP
jgi:class 3 adenylate cyclase